MMRMRLRTNPVQWRWLSADDLQVLELTSYLGHKPEQLGELM